MTSKRALLVLSALLSLLLVVAPASADDSGGVPAQTFTQADGGGVVAPAPDPVVPEAEAAAEVDAAQETTPTTPGGEEQPDG